MVRIRKARETYMNPFMIPAGMTTRPSQTCTGANLVVEEVFSYILWWRNPRIH